MATSDCASHLTQLLIEAYKNNSRAHLAPVNKSITKIIVNNQVEEISSVVVWKFSADADIGYAAVIGNLSEWLVSEAGSWVMANAIEAPECHCAYNYPSWAIECAVTARLAGKSLTEFLLFRKNI